MKFKKHWKKYVIGVTSVIAVCACALIGTNLFFNQNNTANQPETSAYQLNDTADLSSQNNTEAVESKDNISTSAPVRYLEDECSDPATIESAKEISKLYKEEYDKKAQEQAQQSYEYDSVIRDGENNVDNALSYKTFKSSNKNSDDAEIEYYGIDNGTLYISGTSTSEAIVDFSSSIVAPWAVDPSHHKSEEDPFFTITDVVIQSEIHPASCFAWFGCIKEAKSGKTRLSNITNIVGLENIDFSSCEDVSFMFCGCNKASVGESTLSSFNPTFPSATNFDGMFSLTIFDNSLYNKTAAGISIISNAQYAFANCNNLEDIDVSNWDFAETGENNINSLFYNCTNLATIYADNDTDWSWLPSKSEDIGKGAWHMFENCNSLKATGASNTYKYIDNKEYIDANASAYAHVYDGSNSGLFTYTDGKIHITGQFQTADGKTGKDYGFDPDLEINEVSLYDSEGIWENCWGEDENFIYAGENAYWKFDITLNEDAVIGEQAFIDFECYSLDNLYTFGCWYEILQIPDHSIDVGTVTVNKNINMLFYNYSVKRKGKCPEKGKNISSKI